MYDTIAIRFLTSPTSAQLSNWSEIDQKIQRGTNVRESHHLKDISASGEPIRYCYYPSNKTFREDALVIQTSLPKVLFGNNIETFLTQADLEKSIDLLDQIVKSNHLLPAIDIRKGMLSRIDACYNFFVDDNVQEYLDTFSTLVYPNRKRVIYSKEGVQFQSSVVTTKFYDKFVESGDPLAQGILRMESTLRGNRYIQKMMHLDHDPMLMDLTQEWSKSVLNEDLKRLKVKNGLIANKNIAQELLLKKYGIAHGNKLYGFLICLQSSCRSKWLDGMSKRTKQKYLKEIFDAGLAPILTSTKILLPPIEIF